LRIHETTPRERRFAVTSVALAAVRGWPQLRETAAPQGTDLTAQPLPGRPWWRTGRRSASQQVRGRCGLVASPIVPQLDAIVVESLAKNPAWKRRGLRCRMSQTRYERATAFRPQGSLGAGVTRESYNPAPGIIQAPSTPFTLFTVSANVSYAIDIWGVSDDRLKRYAPSGRRTLRAGGHLHHALGQRLNTVIAQAGYRAEMTPRLLRSRCRGAAEDHQLKPSGHVA